MGFQIDDVPLAESRGGVSGGVRSKALNTAFRCSAKDEFKNSPVNCF